MFYSAGERCPSPATKVVWWPLLLIRANGRLSRPVFLSSSHTRLYLCMVHTAAQTIWVFSVVLTVLFGLSIVLPGFPTSVIVCPLQSLGSPSRQDTPGTHTMLSFLLYIINLITLLLWNFREEILLLILHSEVNKHCRKNKVGKLCRI